MAVIVNRTGETIKFEAYDANKVRMNQDDPGIAPGQARYVNQDHEGSADYFFMLAFYATEGFTAAPGMNIIQGTQGGGAGVTIAGFGATASATVTVAYAQPVAAAMVQRHGLWTLNQPGGADGPLQFAQGGTYDQSMLHGW